MSQLTIQHRTAAVRNTWSYGEQVQRAIAAQHRCQRLLEQLGLISGRRELAYARHPSASGNTRRSG